MSEDAVPDSSIIEPRPPSSSKLDAVRQFADRQRLRCGSDRLLSRPNSE